MATTVNPKYIRALTGPQLQEDGVNKNRYPNFNIGNGLQLTEEADQQRYTISIDPTGLAATVVLTSSMGGLTFYNSLVPRFVLSGTIGSGSVASITCSLEPNSSFEPFVRATARVSGTNVLMWTKSMRAYVSYVSGSTPVINFQETVDDNYYPVSMSLTASISSNSLVWAMSCNTGSSYNFQIYGDGSTVTF